MKLTHIVGVKAVQAKMREAGIRTGAEMEMGLKRGGLFLQRLSQKVVPVDTGNLKASAGTRMIGRGRYAAAAVFYTAAYAIYVHERTELRHQPGKIAKFLEEPAKLFRSDILRVIGGQKAQIDTSGLGRA